MTNQTPAISQKEVSDVILSRVTEMTKEGLALPKNYNPSNALQVAFLKLSDMTIQGKNNANYGRKVLDVVTKKSVTESLFNMVLQGLSPAKNQVYFIPYKDELQMQRSYFGTQSSLKRLGGIKDIWANVIYEGDDFQMEINDKGRESLLKHDTHWMNRDNPIQGAYAIIETDTGEQTLTVMTKKEISQSWSQAKSQHVHNKFGQEMAKRTVINRAAKNFLNTSDDSDLLVNAINETTENEFEEKPREDVTESAKGNDLIKKLEEQKEPAPEIEKAEVVIEGPAEGAAIKQAVANRIKEVRESAGLSQEEFAKEIGTTEEVVNAWEDGQSQPNESQNKEIKTFIEQQEMIKELEADREKLIEEAESEQMAIDVMPGGRQDEPK